MSLFISTTNNQTELPIYLCQKKVACLKTHIVFQNYVKNSYKLNFYLYLEEYLY